MSAEVTQLPGPTPVSDDDRESTGARVRRTVVPPALLVALLLGGWLLAVRTIESSLLPAPQDVLGFMVDELRGDTLAKNNVYETFGISLVRLLVGMAAALVLGVLIGLLMGLSRRVSALLDDWVIADLNMPYLLWALLWSLWLGFSFWTPVFTVILAAIPFVITNVAEGVRNVPGDLVTMARSYGVSRRKVLRDLIIPSLAPFLFAGFRYALSLGWKALVVAELFGSDRGVGWTLKFWYEAHRIQSLIGYALFFVLIAVIIDRVFLTSVAKRVFRWRGENAATAIS